MQRTLLFYQFLSAEKHPMGYAETTFSPSEKTKNYIFTSFCREKVCAEKEAF